MKLIKFLFVIIVALVIANVTLTNRSVDESVVMADLSREIELLQNENTILKSEVASAGSLNKISENIATAGFVETPKVVTLSAPSSVASR